MGSNWDFFDNFEEIVYITDMDTYELAYINKKGLEQYGVKRDEVLGKSCYQVLQNNTKPCAMCNNEQLCPGCFLKWSYYNPIIEKNLLLHDTMFEKNGHRYRMEMAIDTTIHEARNREEFQQKNMERLLNDAIAVAIQKPTPDETLECLLEAMGQILMADRVYIFEKNASGNMDNTYEWVSSGVSHEKENLQEVPEETFEVWNEGFKKEHMVVVPDVEAIRESDPMMYAYLKPQNIKSLVVVPFSLHIELAPIEQWMDIDGFFGVDNPPKGMLEHTKILLHIMASFILGTIKRRNLMRELEQMTLTDCQTKLGNRHAMNQYIAKTSCLKNFGVVYCDITGLKHVNDTLGHQAGDELILKACESLRDVFDERGLYRIGGDELIAMCPNTDEQTLLDKVERLNKVSLERGVILATGMYFTKEGEENLEKMITEAEKKMYEDKKQYYLKNGLTR